MLPTMTLTPKDSVLETTMNLIGTCHKNIEINFFNNIIHPSVNDYFIHITTYTRNQTYVTEDRAFLLSMKEMSFNIQADEGNITDLYGEYTNNNLTNDPVAARAKYNKAGGTLNNYRWSRSGYSGVANGSRYVSSTGSHNNLSAYYGFYVAPAFIIGKSVNRGASSAA